MRIIYIPKSGLPLANSKYGLLYNWYAATGGSFVAGWHLPTFDEIWALRAAIGGVGGKLKETGLIHWNSPNTGATNIYGFNGRGGGRRSYLDGSFYSFKSVSYFWNAETEISNGSYILSSSTSDFGFYRNENDFDRKNGEYIRLLCDSTTDPGFVDIDGKRYTTVKIGNQVWMAENLQAKHYANGTAIPEVTDNAAWAALTTPGLCAYNNDLSNV